MWFGQLLKLFLKIFVLKAKPDAIPYSKALMQILLVLVFALKVGSILWFISIISIYSKELVISLSFSGALLLAAVYLLLLVASMRSLLVYYQVAERSVQVISAMLVADLFLGILFLFWLFCLSLLKLPLQQGSGTGLILILYFVLLLYWQFMVYMHIIFNSVTIKLVPAGVLVLIYMLLQHNVTEILLNVVIDVG